MMSEELQEAQRRTRGKARIEPRPGRLTERDLDVLEEVWRYRYVSVSQIHALLFPSRQTALRRLKFLSENSYLASFRIPGIEEQLYALDSLGAEIVAERFLVPLSELGWNKQNKLPSDPWFMRHFLLTSWFRIQLTKELHAHSTIELLGFLPEYVGEVQESGEVKKVLRDAVKLKTTPTAKLSHTPDGVFCLGRIGDASERRRGKLFFLELDRGTEAIANPQKGVLKILRFYLALLATNQHQKKYADEFGVEGFGGFRVLFVTTTATRLEHIREVASKFPWEPAHAKRFIWLAPKEIIHQGKALSWPWRSLDLFDNETYTII